MSRTFRWLWLAQLVSNLGTQTSLYGIGLWSFQRQGQLLDFAAVAFVVQLAKILVLPLLARRLGQWPRRRVMVAANGLGAACTLALALQLLLLGPPSLLGLLPLLAVAAMAEAALVLCFSSLIPLLVPAPEALARANGLFVSSDALVLSLSPFLGSAVVAATGLPGLLLLDGFTFALALAGVLLAPWPLALLRGRLQPPDATSVATAVRPTQLRRLWREPLSRAVLSIGTAMAFVYACTEVLFPAWVTAGPGPARLATGLLVGGVGYLLGYGLWNRWGWRQPRLVLVLGLVAQSLILMGAGLLLFQDWLLCWYSGLLVFSLALPMVLAALQGGWQQLAEPEQLPQLFAQRYRLEWGARLLAFAASAALVDGLIKPALAWPHWPAWLVGSLGQGPGRPLAVGLGAMGWVLLLALLSQRRSWMRG